MRLPNPPKEMDRVPKRYFETVIADLEREDKRNVKKNQDFEVGDARVILTASDGTRWEITVDTAGNLGTSSVS